ncbi:MULTISPECIES: LPXTG cell wall anchor domain-containing protein, partial [Lactococcus]
GTSDKGGGQGTPAPAPGDIGKDKGDEGSQPSSGGNIPTNPATTTSTSTDDTTDRNGQLTSGKGALPKTGETTERPAFGFLGVIVVILMGVLGLKRKQREE